MPLTTGQWATAVICLGAMLLQANGEYDDYDLTPAEGRSVSWMDFSMPQAITPQQTRQQLWLQPPMPVSTKIANRCDGTTKSDEPMISTDSFIIPRVVSEYRADGRLKNQWPEYYSSQQAAGWYPTDPALIYKTESQPSSSISSAVAVQHPYSPVNQKALPVRGFSSQQRRTPEEEEDVDEDYDGNDSSELTEVPWAEEAKETRAGKHVEAARQEDDTEDPIDIDVLSAFSLLHASGGGSSAEETQPSNKIQPPSVHPPAPTWDQLYPNLLGPATPPGKRIIVSEPSHVTSAPKPVDGHRESYGLTAASVYARLQPSLRQPVNGSGGGGRRRVVPRPYRRRPVSPTTTTTTTIAPTTTTVDPFEIEDHEETENIEREEEDDDKKIEIPEQPEITDADEEEIEGPAESNADEAEIDDDVAEDDVAEDDVAEERQMVGDQADGEQQDGEEGEDNEQAEEEDQEAEGEDQDKEPAEAPRERKTKVAVTTENETAKPATTAVPPTAFGEKPIDIKSLLRGAGELSLSEILQQKGMSLADLLKNGGRVAPIVGIATTQSTPTSTEDDTSPTTTIRLKTTVTTPKSLSTSKRPEALPSVKPISFRELLAAKNLSIQAIFNLPDDANKSAVADSEQVTLKPGVKVPVAFNPNRAKGLAGLVAPAAASTEPTTTPTATSSDVTTHRPLSAKPELKPLVFGGKATVDESTISTTTTKPALSIRSKRPYVAGGVGEYGVHMGNSDEEDDQDGAASHKEKSIFSGMLGGYGNQRPIATSRLTPAPPRKQRPVPNYNYNGLMELYDDDDDEEGNERGDATTVKGIVTHFNDEELIEVHPYFDLPLSVRSAIVVSSAIGGSCLLVFLVIFVVFKVRQKTRVRLRHPIALLGGMSGVMAASAAGGGGGGSAGSDSSSGVTTPVSQPASKSGYAKLPPRSSSLWGTLRRSVRQMDSIHSIHYA